MPNPHRKRKPPEVCPVCHETVPPNAVACPECGACHESGWRENTEIYDGVDLLDEAYEDEDGRARWRAKPGMHPFWRIIALLLVIALFWWVWRTVFAAGRTPMW